MNLNYAIFRSEPIYTINDLAQIGSHNKREKQAYKSNPDIKLELKDNNIDNYQLFNLTQMFGSGNEPTIEEFNEMFPNDYYDYTSTAKTLVKNVGTITYNDTDIMSQMTYQMYNACDKYFNFTNINVLNVINI